MIAAEEAYVCCWPLCDASDALFNLSGVPSITNALIINMHFDYMLPAALFRSPTPDSGIPPPEKRRLATTPPHTP